MSWLSEKYFPGGKVVYRPMPNKDWFKILYICPDGTAFFRGLVTREEMVRG